MAYSSLHAGYRAGLNPKSGPFVLQHVFKGYLNSPSSACLSEILICNNQSFSSLKISALI